MNILSITFILCAVILIHRTADATLYSRFLKHIEYAFATTILFRVGNIAAAAVKSVLAYQYLGWDLANTTIIYSSAVTAYNTLQSINNTWHATSVMISYLSTFWLLLAWWLLKKYPEEGIPRGFYSWSIGILGGLITIAAGVVTVIGASAIFIIDFLDIGTSAVAIFLVGWQLRKIEARKVNQALRGVVFLFYACWALMQVGVPIFRDRPEHPFFMVLMFVGFAAMLSTALLTSYILQDKPEYQA
ncbi:membrane hypothetical protein [Candidatus Zixiibacteriota bacterium]|nr:membrane hypothetical protein [candidate division Zixibacteria bacterium]